MQNAFGPESSPRTYAIIGALLEVHATLGCGFLESVYQAAAEIEFLRRGIPFVRELPLTIHYKGQVLKTRFRPDFLCWDSIIVECKSTAAFGSHDQAQVLNYLRATNSQVGLLVNFGGTKLVVQRLVLTPDPDQRHASLFTFGRQAIETPLDLSTDPVTT